MGKKIGALVLDVASAVILALGVVILVSPLIFHLWLGADNDSYIVIAEAGRANPVVLTQFGLEPMFRADFMLWPALLITTGLALRWLLWRWLPVVSPSGVREKAR